MSFVNLANELLTYRERMYDAREKNQHGWPKLRPKTFNWITDQAGIYHIGAGSPLKPHIITPYGRHGEVNLNCDSAEKLYEKQELTEFKDCTTAKEHMTLWKSSPAVKKSIESYKMKDAWTFLNAIAHTFRILQHAENMSMKGWLAYTNFIPYLQGINRADFYPHFPDIRSALPLKQIADLKGYEAIKHLKVIN